MEEEQGGGRPPGIDRRRLLVGLGFTAATAGLVRALPPGVTGADAASPASEPARPRRPDPPSSPVPTDPVPDGRTFDVAIVGGRVIDPETGLDAVVNVGIDGDRIAAVTTAALTGRSTIDAGGLVVTPGFIDILSGPPNEVGAPFKAAEGVTTNLAMHGVNGIAGPSFAAWAEHGYPFHYGGAFRSPFERARMGIDPYEPATPDQIATLAATAAAEVEAGYIGVDVEPEYTPGVDTTEITALGEVAAAHGVPLLFHARYSTDRPPGTNAEALAEILDTARRTGAAVHVEHIVSTGGTFSMAASLATLQRAREEGIAVTACAYPYDFWATYLGSARFDAGWQERYRIDHGDLAIAGTGERLTPESFAHHRRQNTLAVAYAIPTDDVATALAHPLVMVGSDAIIEEGANNHPRAAGTFARTLGRYVRDLGVLSLTEAVAKMTIEPARLLEGRAPALRTKGRLQVGADADVCVLDPGRVQDRATVADPAQASVGIDWVLVAGEAVRRSGEAVPDVRPGRPVTFA
jgi:N-acyl-D-aspartate/D-glutamate deacylase